MFFGLSPIELVVLTGLALMLFGPDKLPGAVREGARIVHHIRSMGESARADLLEQLGPEFAELDPRWLRDPRTVAREKLSDVFEPLQSTRDEVRDDLRAMRDAARFDDHSDRLAALEAQPIASAASTTEPTAHTQNAPGAEGASDGGSSTAYAAADSADASDERVAVHRDLSAETSAG
jgi:sec-independent protein translocase protein TatB